jgi:hypothetical protein
MKTPQILRVICTCCSKGDLVVEDLEQDEIVERHAELCRKAGLLEIPSMAEEGASVFVCSGECETLYKEKVGPFRKRQREISLSDMSGGPLPSRERGQVTTIYRVNDPPPPEPSSPKPSPPEPSPAESVSLARRLRFVDADGRLSRVLPTVLTAIVVFGGPFLIGLQFALITWGTLAVLGIIVWCVIAWVRV